MFPNYQQCLGMLAHQRGSLVFTCLILFLYCKQIRKGIAETLWHCGEADEVFGPTAVEM